MNKLGKILLEMKLISDDQLRKALEYQSRTGFRLGHSLTELHFVTENDIFQALSRQKRFPVFEDEKETVDPAAIDLLKYEYCVKNFCLPYRIRAGALHVAVPDPTDTQLIEDLRFLTGKEIKPIAGLETRILKLLREYHELKRTPLKSAGIAGEGDSEVLNALDKLVSDALYMSASDLHLECFESCYKVRYRIDGVLKSGPETPRAHYPEIVSAVKIRSEMDITERRLPQDGSFRYRFQDRDVDIRVSTVPGRWDENCVLRFLDRGKRLYDLDDLSLDPLDKETILRAIGRPIGLILVTGPTGSGKTTTLYGLLQRLNSPDRKILTIEDPVEYNLENVVQVQVQPEIGLTFAEGLKHFLRHDPDVIMVGEIRDAETAQIALRAAMTGHLVLSTMHTNDTVSALDRLRDMGIPDYMLETVRLIVAQRLLRKWDPKLNRFEGRLPVFEVLEVTEKVRTMLHGRRTDDVKIELEKTGFQDLAKKAGMLVVAGTTTRDEVIRAIGLTD